MRQQKFLCYKNIKITFISQVRVTLTGCTREPDVEYHRLKNTRSLSPSASTTVVTFQYSRGVGICTLKMNRVLYYIILDSDRI